jgi:hypothetical protein
MLRVFACAILAASAASLGSRLQLPPEERRFKSGDLIEAPGADPVLGYVEVDWKCVRIHYVARFETADGRDAASESLLAHADFAISAAAPLGPDAIAVAGYIAGEGSLTTLVEIWTLERASVRQATGESAAPGERELHVGRVLERRRVFEERDTPGRMYVRRIVKRRRVEDSLLVQFHDSGEFYVLDYGWPKALLTRSYRPADFASGALFRPIDSADRPSLRGATHRTLGCLYFLDPAVEMCTGREYASRFVLIDENCDGIVDECREVSNEDLRTWYELGYEENALCTRPE